MSVSLGYRSSLAAFIIHLVLIHLLLRCHLPMGPNHELFGVGKGGVGSMHINGDLLEKYMYIYIYIYIFKISLQSKSFNMVGRAPQKRI